MNYWILFSKCAKLELIFQFWFLTHLKINKNWNRIFIFVQSKMRNIFLNLFTFTTFWNHSLRSVVLKSSYKIGFEKMFLQTCHAIYWVARNDLNPQIVRTSCRYNYYSMMNITLWNAGQTTPEHNMNGFVKNCFENIILSVARLYYALSICTWFLKNQVEKIKFNELVF